MADQPEPLTATEEPGRDVGVPSEAVEADKTTPVETHEVTETQKVTETRDVSTGGGSEVPVEQSGTSEGGGTDGGGTTTGQD